MKDRFTAEQELIKSSDRDNLILGYTFQFFSLILSTYCFYSLGANLDKDAISISYPIELNLTGTIFGALAFFLDFRKSSTAKTANAQLIKGDIKGAISAKRIGRVLLVMSITATASTAIFKVFDAKEELRISNIARSELLEIEKSILDYIEDIKSVKEDIEKKQGHQDEAEEKNSPLWQKNLISNALANLRKTKSEYEKKKEEYLLKKETVSKLITVDEKALIFSGIEINIPPLPPFTIYYIVLGFIGFGALVEFVMFNCKHNISFIKSELTIKKDNILKIFIYNKLGLEKYLILNNVVGVENNKLSADKNDNIVSDRLKIPDGGSTTDAPQFEGGSRPNFDDLVILGDHRKNGRENFVVGESRVGGRGGRGEATKREKKYSDEEIEQKLLNGRLSLNYDEIAKFAGISNRDVSRILFKMRDKELVEKKGNVWHLQKKGNVNLTKIGDKFKDYNFNDDEFLEIS